MRRHGRLLFIPLAALLAVVPLLLKGPSCGHDFQFHLHSWLEVSSQWKQGGLFPHWDFTAAWNSGEPRFVFYPPLSWAIGALLGLILPWAAVPITYIWIALTLCGLGMYRLAREWTSSTHALIPATLYMVHPYMLFTLYERAAYAELLAAAWIPLLFLAILRPRLSAPRIALPIALLCLTNAPAAVMACYTVGLLAAVRIFFTSRRVQGSSRALHEAAQILGGTLLGVGLAAFYVIPAALEQHWVHIKMSIEGDRFQDNYLFGHAGNPSHVAILRTASLCGVSLLVLSGVFLLAALGSGGEASNPAPAESNLPRRALLALSLLACAILFLLTAPSAVLWNHLPALRALQFPWRLCAILGTTAIALLALAMPRIDRRPTAVVLIALAAPLALSFAGNSLFRQFCQPDATIPSLTANFYQGGRYDPFDQYTPVGADPGALGHANPAFWIADTPTAAPPPAAVRDYSVALAHRLHFQVSTPVPAFFIPNLRNYPAWKATVNGTPVAPPPYRKDGLFALPLGSGTSTIDFTYSHTPDQTAGWILSALSALCVLLGLRKQRQHP
jgi:hypothetical protein